MTKYFNAGREAIVEASKAQLRMMDKADIVVFASGYGNSSYLFEMALRRIGENDLAAKFVDSNPDAKVLVVRVSAYNDILTAILANLERGNRDFARALEEMQRQKFYMQDASYVDPHFDAVMKPWEEKKEALRRGLLERGLEGNEKFMERGKPNFFYVL